MKDNPCECYIVRRDGLPLTTADFDKDSPKAPSRVLLCNVHRSAPELLHALEVAIYELKTIKACIASDDGCHGRLTDHLRGIRAAIKKGGDAVKAARDPDEHWT